MGVLDGDVKNPATTVLVYDTPIQNSDNGGRGPDYWGSRWSYWKGAQSGDLSEEIAGVTPSGGGALVNRPRHNKGNVVSFTDGHVKWLRNLKPYASGKPMDNKRAGTEGFAIN
jgi:prepilin-type processing-associated H-X9-DG protein